MGELLRRRAMMAEAESGPKIVTWFDVTLSAEATVISTAKVGSAFVAQYNAEQPKVITISFYPVTPESGENSQTGRMCLWRSGIGIQKNFCGSGSTKRAFDCDKGEPAMETVMTQISGKSYSYTLDTNEGVHLTGSYTWNANANDFFTVRDTTKLGIGTRLVVTAEY